MHKNFIMLLIAILMVSVADAKPYKKVRVYTNKPVKGYHKKPYYVKVQPFRSNVVIIKPVCPGPKYIWIDGDWLWNPDINQYVYVEGKWVIPVQNSVWKPGHWKKTRFGWYWVNGYWR